MPNLSELYLTLGEVQQAVNYARQSVELADQSGDGLTKLYRPTILADALHQAGELAEAERLFREAEAMQRKKYPKYSYLFSLQGFKFCDLLLSQGQYREVQKRASQTLEWVTPMNWLLDIALDQLSLGRALMFQSLEEGNNVFTQAGDFLNQAVAGLRNAERQDHLPRALLARTAWYRAQKNYSKAWDDLEETLEIAERGSMGRFLVDYHLEACRLCEAEGKREEAEEHRRVGRRMAEEMGYEKSLKGEG